MPDSSLTPGDTVGTVLWFFRELWTHLQSPHFSSVTCKNTEVLMLSTAPVLGLQDLLVKHGWDQVFPTAFPKARSAEEHQARGVINSPWKVFINQWSLTILTRRASDSSGLQGIMAASLGEEDCHPD
jgi:hypothetical protein